jgi:hypothetical protein
MTVSSLLPLTRLAVSLTMAAGVITSACRSADGSRVDSDHESSSGWDVFLVNFGEYHDASPRQTGPAEQERRLLVADLRITNLQQRLSTYTFNDFELRAENRRDFKPVPRTANVDHGLVFVRFSQPGVTSESRILFDVDRQFKAFTLTALKRSFRVNAP